MAETATRVFDGDLLRADLFNPGGKRLFVSFRQRVQQDGGFFDAKPVRSFTDEDYAHLHLQSRLNDWYINPETEALEACLTAATLGYGRRVAMGFSMGGYAALRFSRCLDLRHVILVTPQVSIHPGVVPFDRRFRDCAGGFDRDLGDLRRHGRRQLAGVVLSDPFRRLDMRNARMIQALFPRIGLARAACGGHPASRVLHHGRQFPALQGLLLDPPVRARDVTALHRAARAAAPFYWTQLAQVAERRGRASLARDAASRAAALEVAGG
ncbi:MAG: alpha/beta hydrolase [Pseudomonadota bacterium]